VPLAIDEFPMVFVAAALARGETLVSGAAELRHKESDRISVMVAGLRALGVEVEELPDGARIQGGTV
jgi:3-phosphoshikimate 1-carboxyvinyltransferase